MIDQEKVELYARLKAVETVLQYTLAMAYKAGGLKPSGIPDLHDFMIARLGQSGLPGVDPATSDLLMSELNEAIRRILDRAADFHRGLLQTGQQSPLD